MLILIMQQVYYIQGFSRTGFQFKGSDYKYAKKCVELIEPNSIYYSQGKELLKKAGEEGLKFKEQENLEYRELQNGFINEFKSKVGKPQKSYWKKQLVQGKYKLSSVRQWQKTSSTFTVKNDGKFIYHSNDYRGPHYERGIKIPEGLCVYDVWGSYYFRKQDNILLLRIETQTTNISGYYNDMAKKGKTTDNKTYYAFAYPVFGKGNKIAFVPFEALSILSYDQFVNDIVPQSPKFGDSQRNYPFKLVK